ncbi:phosphoribosyltransferase family protein [Streptomyces sp. HSW2009]|uniref:phosphoribosyltransferase family protein n=1 Tax=Streptomyces sp. HSW2009 TaxID=3142890 RepID=UPI0032EF4973
MTTAARDLTLEYVRWIDGHVDVWGVFRDAQALAGIVAGLAEPFRDAQVTAVCGVESRGFLLGGAVAVTLGVGFVPVRKDGGLFPGEKLVRETGPDYRNLRHRLHLQRSALGPTDRVLMVDDWIETGSQAVTVKDIVEECGATWVGCSVMVDELDPATQPTLGSIHSLLDAADLPPCPPEQLTGTPAAP